MNKLFVFSIVKVLTKKMWRDVPKKIEGIGDVDICYLHDPTNPVLAFNTRMKALPFKFHRYISTPKESNSKMPSQEETQEEQEEQGEKLSKFE